YYDEETGTHYNFHRDYKPNLGRYLQSDPIGLKGGVNWFGYAGLKPLIKMDPEGRAPVALIVGGVVALWTAACSIYAFKKAMNASYPVTDDKSRHCMASCILIKCMAGLPAAPAIGIGKEIMDFFGKTGFDVEDISANNEGVLKGYRFFWGDCERDCRGCEP
ncbi:hypothetical protein EII20_14210, partial [Comamonadaceae bacterium OH2545_COT-014]